VRELQNVMAALAVQVPRGRVTAEHVGALVAAQSSDQPRTLEEARRRFDREFVATAIARSGGRYARAARELGVSRQGLAKLLKRLSLEKAG
jgi:DNA-binding NtrC family response regulator